MLASASRAPTVSTPSHSAVFIVMRRSSASAGTSSPTTRDRIQLYENFMIVRAAPAVFPNKRGLRRLYRHTSSELPQKSQVAALQPTDIVDPVTHHDQAREAQPEREAI